MRPLFKIVLLLFALVAVLLGVAWFLLNDPAFLKAQLSSRLEQATGWQLAVQGDLDVTWGRVSIIEVQDVRLLNPHWKGDPLLFNAGRLRLELEPLELLDLRLLMRELVLADCMAQYAENENEAVNWSLAKVQVEDTDPAGSDNSGFTWQLNKLNITNCQASVARKNQDKSLEIVLNQAELELDSENLLSATAAGSVDQQALSLEGEISPLRAVWEGGHLSHTIRLDAGETSLHSKGTIEDFRSGSGANLNFRFTGPEFRNITQWFGVPEFSDGPFDSHINLQKNPETGFMEIGVDGDLGSLKIQGTGRLDQLVSPSSGSIDFRVKGPDLDALGRTLGQEWLIEQPYESELIANIKEGKTQLESVWFETGGNRFSASGYLGPWPGLLGSQLEVKLHSSELAEWQPAHEDGFRIYGPLESTTSLSVAPTGELLVDGTSHLGGGTLRTKGSLGTLDQLGDNLVSIVLEAPSLEKFALVLGEEGLPDLPFKLSGDLHHRGDELQLEDVELNLVGDRLFASGNLQLGDKFRGSQLVARVVLDDLASSGKRFGIVDLPSQPLKLSASLSRTGDGLDFDLHQSDPGDITLNLNGQVPDINRLFAMNARFDVDLPSLSLAGFLAPGQDLPDLPFSAKGEALITSEDHLQIRAAELLLGQSKAGVKADIQLGAGLQGSTATLRLQGADIKELWQQAPDELDLGPYSLAVDWKRTDDGDHFEGIKLDLGVLQVDASGHVPDIKTPRIFDASVVVKGDDASRLNALTGQPLSGEPFSLQFQLVAETELLSMNSIEYRQGKTDISGDLQYRMPTRPKLSGALKSGVLDARPWFQEAVDKQETVVAATADDKKAIDRVFSDEPLDVAENIPLDLDLDLQVQRLLIAQTEFHQISLGLIAGKDLIHLQPFDFKGEKSGHYLGKFLATIENGVSAIEFKADVDDMKFDLGGYDNPEPEKIPPSDVQIDLTGKGKSLHEIVQSLDGHVYWYTGSGIVPNSRLNFFFSDLVTEVLTTLNPLSQKSNVTTVDCGVVAAEFANAQVVIEPIVIQTDKTVAFSKGVVDLASEELELIFNTRARKGLGLSASSVTNPFFKIGGTLKNPAIEFDKTRGMISGGTMFATAGLSILYKSVSDRFLSSKDPCGDARSEIKARSQGSQ